MSSAPKLAVATTFPIHPPRGGGQARVFGLYRGLARLGVQVEIVALVAESMRGGSRELAPGLVERRVPATPAHTREEYALQRRAGVPIGDLALALHHELTPAFGEALAAAASNASAVVAVHPFAQPVLAAVTDAPLIYEAQDVEVDLKASMFEDAPDGEELVAAVRDVEAACCETAHHVIVCSAEDGARLGELYGIEPERVLVVPNGADPEAVRFTDAAGRARNRELLGLTGIFHALFLGSWHEPNLAAVRDVLAAAPEAPDVRFLLLGSAGRAFAAADMPANVDLCGEVDYGFVRSALSFADVALNPMRFGSGTNLKMLEYALAGVPLLSSQFGARGLALEPERHYVAAEPDALPAALAALRDEDPAVTAARVTAVRDHVFERFTWPAIAARWHADPALRDVLAAVPASG